MTYHSPIGFIDSLISAPAALIGAAAGDPQKRRRARAAQARAQATTQQAEAERTSREAAVAAEAATAQAEAEASEAAAKARLRKSLIRNLAIGGGIFAVLVGAVLVATGGKK
jgi:flagellar hook-length control protein FliK